MASEGKSIPRIIAIPDTITEMSAGYYSGLLVEYSKDIEAKKENLIKKVDQ